LSDADHLLFVSVLCIWSIMCILLCLKIVFKSSRGAQIIDGSLLGGTTFCAEVPWYCWVLSVELLSCHVTSVWNFKMPSRFCETLCILEWYYSKSSLCHVKCILSKLIFNILTFWMVQDSLLSYIYIYTHTHTHIYIYIYIYICKFTVFAVCFILVVNTDISKFWKIRMELFFMCIN